MMVSHGDLNMPVHTRGNTKEHTETRTYCIERTYKDLEDDPPISQPFVAYMTVFIDTDMVTAHPRPQWLYYKVQFPIVLTKHIF